MSLLMTWFLLLFSGLKSGLAVLLIRSHPKIVVVHCLAHRLELAFKDTIKKSPSYEKLMTLLLGLYYLYRKSPKSKQGLQRSFEAQEKRMILPTRVGGTRWLPHIFLAIGNFIKGYTALRHHLENSSHTNPKAEGLAKIAADGNVLVFMLSLKVLYEPHYGWSCFMTLCWLIKWMTCIFYKVTSKTKIDWKRKKLPVLVH